MRAPVVVVRGTGDGVVAGVAGVGAGRRADSG